MDPTDPLFWQNLGLKPYMAAIMAFVVGGMFLVFRQRKVPSHKEEMISIAFTRELVLKLANVPDDIAEMKTHQESFETRLGQMASKQSAMAAQLDMLIADRNRE